MDVDDDYHGSSPQSDDDSVYDDADDDLSAESQYQSANKVNFSHNSLRTALAASGVAIHNGSANFVLQLLRLETVRGKHVFVTLSDGVSKIKTSFKNFEAENYAMPGAIVSVSNIAWDGAHWTIASLTKVRPSSPFFGRDYTEITSPPARAAAQKRALPSDDGPSAAAAAADAFPDALAAPRTKRALNTPQQQQRTLDSVPVIAAADPMSALSLIGPMALRSFTGLRHLEVKDLKAKDTRFYLGPLLCSRLVAPAKETMPRQVELVDQHGCKINYKSFTVSFEELSLLFKEGDFYFLGNGEAQVHPTYGISVMFSLSAARNSSNYDQVLHCHRVDTEHFATLKKTFTRVDSAGSIDVDELIALSQTQASDGSSVHRNVSVRCIVAEVGDVCQSAKNSAVLYRRLTLAKTVASKINVTVFQRSSAWKTIEELFGSNQYRCTPETVRSVLVTNMTVTAGDRFPYNLTDQSTVCVLDDTPTPATAASVVVPIAPCVGLEEASRLPAGATFSAIVLVPACSEPRVSTFEGRSGPPKCVVNMLDQSGPHGCTRERINLLATSSVVSALRRVYTAAGAAFVATTSDGMAICLDPPTVVPVYFQNLSLFAPTRAASGDPGGFGASLETRKFFVFGRDSNAEILQSTDARCKALVEWFVEDGFTKFSPDLLASKEAVLNGLANPAAAHADEEKRVTPQQRAADAALMASMTSAPDPVLF